MILRLFVYCPIYYIKKKWANLHMQDQYLFFQTIGDFNNIHVIMELVENNDNFYIRVYYNLELIKISDCDKVYLQFQCQLCPLHQYLEISKLSIPDNWLKGI